MIRVGIIGATGYAGAELVRILCGHPDIELTILTSRQYAGLKFDEIFPSMTGSVNPRIFIAGVTERSSLRTGINRKEGACFPISW